MVKKKYRQPEEKEASDPNGPFIGGALQMSEEHVKSCSNTPRRYHHIRLLTTGATLTALISEMG